MSVNRVNHGPCRVCGRPILYLGGLYCGPGCNRTAIEGPATDARAAPPSPVPVPETEDHQVPEDVLPTEVASTAPAPEEPSPSVPEAFPEVAQARPRVRLYM